MLKLWLNNFLFSRKLAFIKKSKDLSVKKKLSISLLSRLSILNRNFKHTGYFSSEILESVFIELANEHPMPEEPIPAQQHSFLHVLTVGWSMGGHTRVTENWILNSPEHEIHSVVFVNQDYHPALDFVKSAVAQRNGSFTFLGRGGDDIEKAMRLRKLSLSHENIVLNICTDDYIPLIAYGHKEFPRSILLFAQSDFAFWLGVSIADVVLELSHAGMMFSRQRRGVENNHVLPCPISSVKSATTGEAKERLRMQLGIDGNTKILVTMGSPYKYYPWGKFDFVKTLNFIMSIEKNTVCFVIGPDSKDPNFRRFPSINNRMTLFGILPLEEASIYLDIADLYLDSFPVFGGMAGLDLVKRQIPCISLQTPIFHFNYSINSLGFCTTETEFIEKAVRALRDQDYAQKISSSAFNNAMTEHSLDQWSKRLREILQVVPSTHKIHEFKAKAGKKDFQEIDYWLSDFKMDRKMRTRLISKAFLKLNCLGELFHSKSSCRKRTEIY